MFINKNYKYKGEGGQTSVNYIRRNIPPITFFWHYFE